MAYSKYNITGYLDGIYKTLFYSMYSAFALMVASPYSVWTSRQKRKHNGTKKFLSRIRKMPLQINKRFSMILEYQTLKCEILNKLQLQNQFDPKVVW